MAQTSVINNENLLNMCRDCGAGAFVPDASYTFDAVAKTVTVTDSSTYNTGGSGDLKKLKVSVHDFFGGKVVGEIIAGDLDSAVTVNVATLNLSKPLALKVTVITEDDIIADGGAYGLMAAGDVAHWDVEKRAPVA